MPSDLAIDSAGVLAVECYKRVAKIQVVFGSLAADEGCPLTEEQAVLLAQVTLDCLDGLQTELAELLTCDSELRTGMLNEPARRLLGWQPDPRAYNPHDPEVGR